MQINIRHKRKGEYVKESSFLDPFFRNRSESPGHCGGAQEEEEEAVCACMCASVRDRKCIITNKNKKKWCFCTRPCKRFHALPLVSQVSRCKCDRGLIEVVVDVDVWVDVQVELDVTSSRNRVFKKRTLLLSNAMQGNDL